VVRGQQVLLDAPVEAGELTLYPTLGENLEPGSDYYYVPNQAHLAEDERGRPQFSFLRYVENVRPGEGEETAREGEGGGIVHAVVQLDVEASQLREAEAALSRVRPGARIVGPVVYRSGTFGLVSSFRQENGDLTRQVVGLGSAPVLEGSRAAISMRLTKLGSKILWESFEMAQPDISFEFEMEMAGLRAPIRARLEADWDRIYRHQAFQAGVAGTLLAGEVSAAFDDLRDSGAIRLVQVGEDAEQAKMVQVAYDKLATLMLEPVQGTGMPSLGQLAGEAGGGGLLDRASKMLQAAREEAGKTEEKVARAARPAANAPNAAAKPTPKPTPKPTADESDATPDDESEPKAGDDAKETATPEESEADRLQIRAAVADAQAAYFDKKSGIASVKIEELREQVTEADSDIHGAVWQCFVDEVQDLEARFGRLAERSRARALQLRNRLASRGLQSESSADVRVDELARQLMGRAGTEISRQISRDCVKELRELDTDDLSPTEARKLEASIEALEGLAKKDEKQLATSDAEIARLRGSLGLTEDDVAVAGSDQPESEEADAGQNGRELASHVASIAVADAENAGPPPKREAVDPDAAGPDEAGPAEAGGGGEGGRGGAGGAGGGGAGASGSKPSFAVVAALQLRKVRQRGTFELDMSKYMAGSQVITFDEPIGDLSRYKGDDQIFREVNLDQPLFRQREVAFQLDGLNASDFGQYVNFVNVQLRRGADVREELTVRRDEFNERGNDFRLIYGFSGQESRDEWMRFEYRTVWSLFNGLTVEEPWETTQAGAVALAPPYIRRTVELEGDPAALDGVRAVTARLYYAAGEEERFSELTLRPGRGETVGTADVLLPPGETEYEYEITWIYGNNRSETTGRQRTSNPILYLDPPQE
jgi:hypothetical protein